MALATIENDVTVCKRYRKAIVGFLSAVVPLLAALVSSHVLNGDVSDWISKGLVAATPLLTLLGVAVAPKNQEFAEQAVVTVDAVVQALRAARTLQAEYEGLTHPAATGSQPTGTTIITPITRPPSPTETSS